MAGRIVAFNDYQLKEGDEPRFYPSGNPVMGVRIALKLGTGEQTVLYAEDPKVLHAIAKALRRTGARDIRRGGFLAVEGATAVYERPRRRRR